MNRETDYQLSIFLYSVFRHEVLWRVLELLPYSRLGLLAKVILYLVDKKKILDIILIDKLKSFVKE